MPEFVGVRLLFFGIFWDCRYAGLEYLEVRVLQGNASGLSGGYEKPACIRFARSCRSVLLIVSTSSSAAPRKTFPVSRFRPKEMIEARTNG